MPKVGVIGFPIGHSLSPAMHNAAFAYLGMTDWHYDAMEIPPDIVRYGVLEPKRHGYVGINVTVPHKQAVMNFVEPDAKAQAIGAVNTIDFRDDSGTNTDVDGLLGDLAAHSVPVRGERVVVLGAGGAARAAVFGLAQSDAEVVVVNRTAKRAHQLVMDMDALAGLTSIQTMSLADAVDWKPSLIVNCTSLGMVPKIGTSPWDDAIPFPKGVTLYDMVYRPATTTLMRTAEVAGGQAINGLGMLVRQGAEAFRIWTGRDAPIDVMFNAVQTELGSK